MAASTTSSRGDALLLRHLAAFERMIGEERPSATARLEQELGETAARALLRELRSLPRGRSSVG